ncbi:MAG: type IX secretion system anionic LPS delivery protein PorZ, partial [Bacteroidia bacterium]
SAYGQDSMYVFDGTSWSHFIPPGFPASGSGYIAYSIKNNFNQLLLVFEGSLYTFNSSLVGIGYYSGYTGSFTDVTRAKDAVVDNAGSIWIADSKYGLVSWQASAGGYGYRYPNGPASERVINMSLNGDALWVAPGGVNGTWQGLGFADGLYSYTDKNWGNTNANYPSIINFDTTYDIMNVLVDSLDPKRVYVATWGEGLIELYNGVPVKTYTNLNSSLQTLGTPGYTPLWTYGLDFDGNRNLWISNPGVSVTKSISVKKTDGTWQNFDFGSVLGSSPYLGQMLVDNLGQKWVVITRDGGLMVTNVGTAPTTIVPGVNAKKLSTSPGNGALPSLGVQCLAKDQDGQIWVGTDKGICVFYSPENVFTGSNFDSQQILLEQDGHVQILLLTEIVQAIAVDDANRKWIGTANSGVFLMSSDGTKQIEHFDETNSPLFSNDIKSIVINHKTGEVYFGTAKGIISYRGTSTQSYDDFTDVYAFPNPVKHEYTGPIAIKGLMNNSTLKITDISGTLVYETKSEGGQALWYATNFKNERVSSGVYMVFCTSEDGSKKFVTKILVIN